ncbi:MAG TPA: transcriptional regulator [Clostridiales bacterium UBA8960]|jgi:transcriptional regulator with XRE-family HTH domain|nr:transcriptional regulator [Clostridiales bacterium UBA8960]
MNQAQIGKFIAELRKEQNMTQVELGDRLGVTNKTVSRWENGNYMPDLSIINALCALFDITVNELFSGTRISDSNFKASADQNLLLVLSDMKFIKKQKKLFDFLSGSGTGILLSTFYSPDSIRRTIAMLVGLAMIFLSWYFKSQYDKRILQTLDVLSDQHE